MLRNGILILLFISFLNPVFGNDMDSLTVEECNTRGFNLYEEKKYSEALSYFIVAIQKDSGYAHSNFNYACVLSLLREGGEEQFGGVSTIQYHLLRAAITDEKYFSKWRSDPDLKWFRGQLDSSDPIWNLKTSIDSLVLEGLLSNGHPTWYLGTRGGIAIDFITLTFSGTGTVFGKLRESSGPDKSISGSYKMRHNLLLFQFENEYSLYDGAFGTVNELIVIYQGKDQYGEEQFTIIYGGGLDNFSSYGAGAERDGA